MAFTTAAVTSASNGPLNKSLSLGPIKIQVLNFTLASGDTSGTATFDRLSSIDFVIASNVLLTSAPTFAGNVATFAFTDAVATRAGQLVAFGR